MAAYTAIDNPELYFQCKLYTGNATGRDITLDGSENMSPNLVWIKVRSEAEASQFYDTIRGVQKRFMTHSIEVSETVSQGLTAFNADGFTLGTGNGANKNTETYVAWCWKAGTSFTNDASSTGIGTIDSSGSVSDVSGFSLCTYTGTGSNATLKHGLSSTPEYFIIKNISSQGAWRSFTTGTGNQSQIALDQNDAADSGSTTMWNSTSPTSSVLSVGTHSHVNASSDTYMGYVFRSVQGFSKMGTYQGNNNTDGAYVHLGFRPAFLMIRRTDAGTSDWAMLDNKRLGYNKDFKLSYANLVNAEEAYPELHFVSNGFKLRGAGALSNDPNTYFYVAFAEAPFVNSKGVPNNAR